MSIIYGVVILQLWYSSNNMYDIMIHVCMNVHVCRYVHVYDSRLYGVPQLQNMLEWEHESDQWVMLEWEQESDQWVLLF